MFKVIDDTIPSDWVCNYFSEGPSLIVGPKFIAQDAISYNKMIDLESPQIDLFWGRVERLKN